VYERDLPLHAHKLHARPNHRGGSAGGGDAAVDSGGAEPAGGGAGDGEAESGAQGGATTRSRTRSLQSAHPPAQRALRWSATHLSGVSADRDAIHQALLNLPRDGRTYKLLTRKVGGRWSVVGGRWPVVGGS